MCEMNVASKDRNRLLRAAFLIAVGLAALRRPSHGAEAGEPDRSAEVVSQIAAKWIAEAIPREYERSKDWGRTKQITTGVRSSGNFFKFDVHRRKSEVKHGVWKKYRVTLVEPDKNLVVRIENLRSTGPGRTALTLLISAKVTAWARAKVYERGIHLIALEAEADTSIRLALDAEISLESIPTTSWLPGVAVRPVVTDARITLENFRLTRISDLRGSLARELGDGLRHVIEDELAGPEFVAKLNRSIDKRRERLQFTPDQLFGHE
jgi:hypothetical protein